MLTLCRKIRKLLSPLGGCVICLKLSELIRTTLAFLWTTFVLVLGHPPSRSRMKRSINVLSSSLLPVSIFGEYV